MTENTTQFYLLTQGLALLTLIAVLVLGLLPALLSGFLIYYLVKSGGRFFSQGNISQTKGRFMALSLLTLVLVSILTLGVTASASYFTDGQGSLVILFRRMADIVAKGRDYLPDWIRQYLPANLQEWQVATAGWLRENAGRFSVFGQEVGIFLVHIFIGMIIGGLIALNPGFQETRGPLAQALAERVSFLGTAFRRIVFSQIRISALNTVLTAFFIAIILPMAGYPLPLTKTMIAVTFIVGLLPIIGNLISNTVITLIALSVAPIAAFVSLLFLVIIHKLEYFINAHIIGTRIKAQAWELLIIMLVMESVFGIPGVVAAPIYYAYLKDELSAQKLI
ncbi:MAG: hypothetical protein Q8J76_13640 [Desulfobulbaceae bacterium]|nr:hypothetical protein [Desulfobulbaceae bacterium]